MADLTVLCAAAGAVAWVGGVVVLATLVYRRLTRRHPDRPRPARPATPRHRTAARGRHYHDTVDIRPAVWMPPTGADLALDATQVQPPVVEP